MGLCDVSFQSSVRLAELWVRWTTAGSAGSLTDLAVEALSHHERVVTICLSKESVSDYDIKVWLSR